MKQLLLLSVGLGVLACVTPTKLCGCAPPPEGVGTIAGVVTRAGIPVPDAEVQVGVRQSGCANDLVLRPSTRTDAAGSYRYQIRGAADNACVRVVARAPGSVHGDSAMVDGIRLRLVPPGDALRPAESVRVDLQLPADGAQPQIG